jgi:hypothetical protein
MINPSEEEEKPVKVLKDGFECDTNRMLYGKDYFIVYDGITYRLRKLENDSLEIAEIVDD